MPESPFRPRQTLHPSLSVLARTRVTPRVTLVEKEACFCVLYHPLKPFLQVLPSHSATAHDSPGMGVNLVEPESLVCR